MNITFIFLHYGIFIKFNKNIRLSRHINFIVTRNQNNEMKHESALSILLRKPE